MTDNLARCCDTCRFNSFDMDGTFCLHPKSLEISRGYGASNNRMGLEGHCQTGRWGNKPAIVSALWEPKS